MPFVELDAIFWGPDWSFPDDKVFFRKLASALEGENWVLDGNYTRTISLKWDNIDTVIGWILALHVFYIKQLPGYLPGKSSGTIQETGKHLESWPVGIQ